MYIWLFFILRTFTCGAIQTRQLAVPAASALAVHTRSAQLQDKVEQQHLKRLVLNYEQREEAEELKGLLSLASTFLGYAETLLSFGGSEPYRCYQDPLYWMRESQMTPHQLVRLSPITDDAAPLKTALTAAQDGFEANVCLLTPNDRFITLIGML